MLIHPNPHTSNLSDSLHPQPPSTATEITNHYSLISQTDSDISDRSKQSPNYLQENSPLLVITIPPPLLVRTIHCPDLISKNSSDYSR